MAHELEFVNGQACIAYAGQVPWHGLGVQVSNDLTPVQMLEAAGLDWRVNPIELFAEVGDEKLKTGHAALVRDSDNKVLDVITDDWHPTQNIEAFEFFNDFVAAGEMEMHTAGSLRGGKIVWALAKTNESFELFKGKDVIDSYLHFTNSHQYGKSIDVRSTSIRVVCANTLTASLSQKSKNMVKVSHRRKFDADEVKLALGISKQRLNQYKEVAEYLSKTRYKNEDIVDYFKRVFPLSDTSEKDMSKNARIAMDVMNTQPGAELGEGSFWQLFNTTTYMVDHLIGRSVDTRLNSAWYGGGSVLKNEALKIAAKMAEVA